MLCHRSVRALLDTRWHRKATCRSSIISGGISTTAAAAAENRNRAPRRGGDSMK